MVHCNYANPPRPPSHSPANPSRGTCVACTPGKGHRSLPRWRSHGHLPAASSRGASREKWIRNPTKIGGQGCNLWQFMHKKLENCLRVLQETWEKWEPAGILKPLYSNLGSCFSSFGKMGQLQVEERWAHGSKFGIPKQKRKLVFVISINIVYLRNESYCILLLLYGCFNDSETVKRIHF